MNEKDVRQGASAELLCQWLCVQVFLLFLFFNVARIGSFRVSEFLLLQRFVSVCELHQVSVLRMKKKRRGKNETRMTATCASVPKQDLNT